MLSIRRTTYRRSKSHVQHCPQQGPPSSRLVIPRRTDVQQEVIRWTDAILPEIAQCLYDCGGGEIAPATMERVGIPAGCREHRSAGIARQGKEHTRE